METLKVNHTNPGKVATMQHYLSKAWKPAAKSKAFAESALASIDTSIEEDSSAVEQEALSSPRQEAQAAMDSGKGTSSDQPRCSTRCLLASEASEPQHRPWADLPADILGVVVARLALLEDRARLCSVCHAWNAAARLHRRPPPPLPLLVLSDFSFSSFRAAGTSTMTGARRRVPLPETETTAEAGSVRCVGSVDGGWLVAMERDQIRDSGGDIRCFLVNPFSQDTVLLPSPCATTHLVDGHSWSLPIANGGSGLVMNCEINAARCVMSFLKVILSSPPNQPGKDYVAAAISMVEGTTKLALWRPGMKSWCVCYGSCIDKFVDVIFCQGKLYLLSTSELGTDLFSLELLSDEDDDGSGLMVSRVERREIEWPDVVRDGYQQNWSIAEWRGKMVIVATYTADDIWKRIVEVRVLEAHLGADPVRFTEIKSLDGDCIFVSPCNSRSFRSCHYDGLEADLVYFIDGYLTPDKDAHPFYKFVYNMRDGTMAPFAADVPKDKLRTPDGILMHPTWLFPPE